MPESFPLNSDTTLIIIQYLISAYMENWREPTEKSIEINNM